MSEFHVEVVRLGPVTKHPNADSLAITNVHGGYPVICRLGEFEEGMLATYIPVDAVVPDQPQWAFLNGSRRIRAKRLRGVFSMGMLTAAPAGANEGDNVGEALGITKWEPGESVHGADPDAEPVGPSGHIPVYDLEGLRRWMDVLKPGEYVIITEKIHGENARFYHDGERLWVGSRVKWKRLDTSNGWAEYARAYQLEEKLSRCPGLVFYGELYGNTDLKYDTAPDIARRRLRLFDIFDVKAGKFVDHNFWSMLPIPPAVFEAVPELYSGPWDPALVSLAEGQSTLGDHVREGFVVRPLEERWDECAGRVVFKYVGQGYLTRKGG